MTTRSQSEKAPTTRGLRSLLLCGPPCERATIGSADDCRNIHGPNEHRPIVTGGHYGQRNCQRPAVKGPRDSPQQPCLGNIGLLPGWCWGRGRVGAVRWPPSAHRNGDRLEAVQLTRSVSDFIPRAPGLIPLGLVEREMHFIRLSVVGPVSQPGDLPNEPRRELTIYISMSILTNRLGKTNAA